MRNCGLLFGVTIRDSSRLSACTPSELIIDASAVARTEADTIRCAEDNDGHGGSVSACHNNKKRTRNKAHLCVSVGIKN